MTSRVLIAVAASLVACGQLLGCTQAQSSVDGGAGGGGEGVHEVHCKPGRFSGSDLDSSPVVTPNRPPPAISGGTVAVMADGTVVVGDSDRDLVWVASTDGQSIRQVDLRPGDEPGRVVGATAGVAFVALRRGGAVAQVDLEAGLVVARYPVCPSPRGLAWVEAESTLAVACQTGTLARLHFAGGGGLQLVSTTTSHPSDDLRDVVALSGALYVSTFRDARILRVDPSGTATEIQTQRTKTVGTAPGTEFVAGVAWRMVATPNGLAMLHQWSQTTEVQESDCVTYSAANGTRLVHAGLTVFENGVATEWPSEVAFFEIPIDLTVTSNDDWALAGPTSWHVSVANRQGIHTDLGTPGQPVAVAARGQDVVVFTREPSTLVIVHPGTAPTAPIVLPGASVRSTGQDIFYTTSDSQLTCASCHPEAGDDGRVWNLPEGRRRTATLRGGLKTTAPFHWKGELVDMPAVVKQVMVKRMGGQGQSQKRIDALTAWLDAQPALPPREGADSATTARGEALFNSTAVGCSTCHSGPQGTNNGFGDVGTGEVFQVPRLVELDERPPYFHDGRVQRLEDRFGAAGGGELHGHTAQLTDDQRSDLIAYLRSF